MRESVLSNLEGLRMASTPMERDNFVNVIIEQFDCLYRENKELCHDKEILMEWVNDNKNMKLLVLDLIKQQKYQELKAENARLTAELAELRERFEVTDDLLNHATHELAAYQLRIRELEARWKIAETDVMDIVGSALSGDCEKYQYFDRNGKRYVRWGIVGNDLRAVFYNHTDIVDEMSVGVKNTNPDYHNPDYYNHAKTSTDNNKPSISDVSVTPDVLMDIKTGRSVEKEAEE